jgi:hypothetical protein
MVLKSVLASLLLLVFCLVSTLHASDPSQSPAQKVETMVQEAVNLVKAKGSGWIETPWPKPGQTKEMKCRAFLKGVTLGGRLLIIGAPLYLE